VTKKTLYIENPAYLSLKNMQLVAKLPEVEKNDTLPDTFRASSVKMLLADGCSRANGGLFGQALFGGESRKIAYPNF
jgi:hypothetical protein